MTADRSRDRDAAGRARNSRPRDATGRPLPRGAVGVPQLPDDLVLTGPAAVAEADRLLAAGRPFSAHEVLEAAWKHGPAGERQLWQGLAQIAVGLTHLQRGNAGGAAALLLRGTDRIRPYAADPPHGVAVAEVVAATDRLRAQVAAAAGPLPPADLGRPLRAG